VQVQQKVTDLKGNEDTAADQKSISEYNNAQLKKMIILKNALDASHALEQKNSDESLKLIEKENAAEIKAANEQISFYDKSSAANQRIAVLKTQIADQDTVQAQKMAIATGQMTEQQAVQQSLKDLEANKAAEMQQVIARLNEQFDLVQKLKSATNDGTTGTDDQKAQYNKAVEDWQAMEEKKYEITKQFNQQINAARLQLANNEHSQWNKMFQEFSQIQKNMSQEARQVLGQMNSSIASFVVTGKGNFTQLATSAIESFVQMGLQYAESKTVMVVANKFFGTDQDQQTTQTIAGNTLMATSAAALAAANTLAFTSAFYPPPVPEGFAASTYTLGLSYAAMASAERGAVLPNRDMMVHTHPEEMILPQHISSFIVNAASNASGSNSGSSKPAATPHFHYSPNVNTFTRQDMNKMLDQHGDLFVNRVMSKLRCMNR
jgi:hypothetical protein